MPFSQQRLQAYLALHGYIPIETPIIEPIGLFLTKAGDQIIDRLFSFDRSNRQFALRPEFTASAAYHYVQQQREDVVRWQFHGAIFEEIIGDNIHTAQINSAGAELIGLAGSTADAEIIGTATEGISQQGVTDYQLVIGHVGLTRRLLQSFKLDDRALRFLLNHRAYLKSTEGKAAVIERLDRYLSTANRAQLDSFDPLDDTQQASLLFTNHQQQQTLGGRTHEDITRRLLEKQKRLASRSQILEALDFLVEWGGIQAPATKALTQIAPFIQDDIVAQELFVQWQETLALLSFYNIPDHAITLQPDLARTWDYYTGMVFEVLSTDSAKLAGGGRYDELTRLIGGVNATPAVGFAYYLDAIIAQIGVVDASKTANFLVGEGVAALKWAQYLRAHHLAVAIVPDLTGSPDQALYVIDEAQIKYGARVFTQKPEDIQALITQLETRS